MEVPDRTAKWLYFEEWHVQHVKVRHGSVQNLWWLCRLGTHYHARCSTLLLGGLPHHNKHLQCPGQEASQNKRSCTHFRELLFPASYRWLFIYKSESIHNLNAFSSQNIPATSRGTRGNIRGSQQVDGRRLATDWHLATACDRRVLAAWMCFPGVMLCRHFLDTRPRAQPAEIPKGINMIDFRKFLITYFSICSNLFSHMQYHTVSDCIWLCHMMCILKYMGHGGPPSLGVILKDHLWRGCTLC